MSKPLMLGVLAAAALATAPVSGQCLVESIDDAVPHGKLVCAAKGSFTTVSADGLTVEHYRLGADGHTALGTIDLAGEQALSIDSVLSDDGVEAVAVASTFSSFYLTAVHDVDTGVSTPIFFSGAQPIVSITDNAAGTWLAVAFADGGPAGSFFGDVQLYHRLPGGTTWSQHGILASPDASSGDAFGSDVAIRGDTLAISAPGEDGTGTDRGALYMYRWDGADWNHATTVYGEVDNDPWYTTVAAFGDTVVAGSPNYDSPTVDVGAVDWFEWDGAGFASVGGAIVSDAGARLGTSVDIDGTQCIAGTDGDFAVSFEHDGSNWVAVGNVDTPSAGLATSDVAIDASASTFAGGTRIYVGDPTHDSGAGAVHVYTDGLSTVTDLGNGLAGFLGMTPGLSVTNDVCQFGGEVDFLLTDMRPTSLLYLFLGLSEANSPFKGGVFVPGSLFLDVSGIPTFGGSFPFTLDAPYGIEGLTIFMQGWIVDPDAPLGASATNGLRIDFGG